MTPVVELNMGTLLLSTKSAQSGERSRSGGMCRVVERLRRRDGESFALGVVAETILEQNGCCAE
jgi:hypothetical protein